MPTSSCLVLPRLSPPRLPWQLSWPDLALREVMRVGVELMILWSRRLNDHYPSSSHTPSLTMRAN